MSNARLYQMGKVDSPSCSLCGHEEQTVDHLLWRCTHPKLIAARGKHEDNSLDFSTINCDDLTPALRIGIPPAMLARNHCCYWGTEYSEMRTNNNECCKWMGCSQNANDEAQYRRLVGFLELSSQW